jgi:hypothetical protein
MHGTLYGCLFHIDAFELAVRSGTREEIEKRLTERLFALLWMGSTSMFELVEWVFGFTKQTELLEKARASQSAMKDYVRVALTT